MTARWGVVAFGLLWALTAEAAPIEIGTDGVSPTATLTRTEAPPVTSTMTATPVCTPPACPPYTPTVTPTATNTATPKP